MLFMKEANLPLYFVKSHGASLFTFLYNSHDLLIMHVCDTFCDGLAITYVISIHCNHFTVNIPVFMKYIPVQIFKTIM